ncbi:MAG: Tfp pilus assembly protein FimT/FimU [Candidatus Acidiferrales bacterium]
MSSRFQLFKGSHTARNTQRGFSMVELMIVLLVILLLTAIALPQIQAALNFYRLNSAVGAVTWAVQSTRYQAIMHGYPYQVAFNATTNNYQVLSEPGGAVAFSNVGSAVPISGDAITLSQTEVLQFSPNGSVSAVTGQMNFSISYMGSTKTVTVSNYGSISVQ